MIAVFNILTVVVVVDDDVVIIIIDPANEHGDIRSISPREREIKHLEQSSPPPSLPPFSCKRFSSLSVEALNFSRALPPKRHDKVCVASGVML